MTERPILFSGAMVKALLDGTKTQTRRAVKLPTLLARRGGDLEAPTTFRDPGFGDGEYLHVALRDGSVPRVHCPYADTPGDRLWVRETWASHFIYADVRPRDILIDDKSCLFYMADGGITGGCEQSQREAKWRPAIHMPRAASRITLEVTGVRVERLQSISRGDAMAEGCPFPNMAAGPDPRKWYAELWDEINGPGAWDLNPWTWIVEFRRVK